MFQTDQVTAATSLPTPAAAGTPGWFTNGNPVSGVPATILEADFCNMVMMELINIVVAAGLTPSKTTYNQVLQAIKALSQSKTILADTGTANTYSAVNATPLTSSTWVDGVTQQVRIAHANTGASTYAPDGLPAIPIYGLELQPLQGTEMPAGSIAALKRETIAGVNSGNPICVLTECAGGALQLPPSTQSGHAVNQSQVYGIAQTRQVLTGSRALGTTYTNSTGKPITIHATATAAGTGSALGFFTDGAEGSISIAATAGNSIGVSAVVMPGSTYSVSQTGGATLNTWIEYR